MNNPEKRLTYKINIGKLSKKEDDIRLSRFTGRKILIVDCNQGGVTNVMEYIKSDS